MTLTDRYVAAVVRHLPASQHDEVAADLRSLISDAIEVELATGAPAAKGKGGKGAKAKSADECAETRVLQDLGYPARLAAKYADRPMYLIGPANYFTWWRLLTLLIATVAPIVAIIAGVSTWLADESFWAIVGETLGAAIITSMAIAFGLTLVFAVLERRGESITDEAEWQVSQLPEERTGKVTRSDAIAEVTILLIVGALLLWHATSPGAMPAFGLSSPIINPAMPAFVIPGILVVIGAQVVATIVRQIRGHWTMRDWWINLGIQVASLAIVVPVLFAGDFLNPAAFAEIGWPDANSPVDLNQLQQLIALVVVIAAVADVISSYRKVLAARDTT